MDLTTVARVKARATRLTGASADSLLAVLVSEVSEEAEVRMARYTETVERTEVFDVRPGQHLVRVPGIPITSVSAVSLSTTPVFEASDLLTADTDWYLLADTGHVKVAASVRCDSFLEVTYTGGMAVDTTAFIAAYPDIVGAVEQEVINRYNAKDLPAGEIQFGNQGGVKRPGYASLPIFEQVCRRYRLRRLS